MLCHMTRVFSNDYLKGNIILVKRDDHVVYCVYMYKYVLIRDYLS